MFAKQPDEFHQPQGANNVSYADAAITEVEPWDVGAVRKMAERERSFEARRLIDMAATRLGDLVLSRRRWTI